MHTPALLGVRQVLAPSGRGTCAPAAYPVRYLVGTSPSTAATLQDMAGHEAQDAAGAAAGLGCVAAMLQGLRVSGPGGAVGAKGRGGAPGHRTLTA